MTRLPLIVVVAALAVAGAGCRTPASEQQSASQGAPAEHEHRAPHGGTLIEIGKEFAHIELVLDRSSGAMTAYMLDGEAEESVRIAQPAIDLVVESPAPAGRVVRLEARGSVLTGETPGDTSEFGAADAAFKAGGTIKGQIAHIVVKGQAFDHVAFVL